MIINHNGCGLTTFTDAELEAQLRAETGEFPHRTCPVLLLHGCRGNTLEQVAKARSHPWISPDVPIRGFVFDVDTGLLSEVFPLTASATSPTR